jgi:hypothetical protein
LLGVTILLVPGGASVIGAKHLAALANREAAIQTGERKAKRIARSTRGRDTIRQVRPKSVDCQMVRKPPM